MDIAAVIKPEALRLNTVTREQLDRIESGVIRIPTRPTRKVKP